MKKLVLIDSNAIIHRAYHAIPTTLKNRAGEQTNVAYGFVSTLIKVLEDIQPEFVVASFDLAAPTFRHIEYKKYKQNRVKADQELYDQIPRVRQLLETMEIPIYEKEGFEADDIIGTIAERLKGEDIEIFIVSGDKDIFQLINGKIKVYNLRRGLRDTQIVDREVIKKEYNLDPEDFIDLKALAGDPSDNIPGVPGIGQKTATTLLQQFDTLENLYKSLESKKADIEKISPRIQNLLTEFKEQAFLSKRLATIDKNAPIDFELAKTAFGDYDRSALKELFETLGFQSFLRRASATSEKIDTKNTKDPTNPPQKKSDQLKLL